MYLIQAAITILCAIIVFLLIIGVYGQHLMPACSTEKKHFICVNLSGTKTQNPQEENNE